MRPARILAVAWITLFYAAGVARAETDPGSRDLFDPSRHMHVSEVRAGMKGYGLSVFKGTKIDRFEVEVIDVLHNFNPQYDVVLVSCKGANLEHTGSIAGMSGSPIFLKDDSGKERMIGAFAYGWPLMKDPIGGVQPIEYMLKIHPTTQPNANTTHPAAATQASAKPGEQRWNLSDVAMLPGMSEPPAAFPFASLNDASPNPCLGVPDDNLMRPRPLATPLMVSGLSPKLLEQLTPLFKSYGMVPLQAGGGSPHKLVDAKLEPGSVLAVPLLTGDVEFTAVGTCTEVIGDRVLGFGHPFNNEGPVSLPICTGEIHAIIANLMTSFKLGSGGVAYGSLFADTTVGVGGKLGPPPPTIPIDIDVHNVDGSGDRNYHFDAAWHPRMTPLISVTAIASAITGVHDLPEFHTIDYDADIDYMNGQKIHLSNSLVNVSMPELFFEWGTPLIAASQNPFEQVSVKSIKGKVTITPNARDATILWVNVPRLKYRPGETLKAYVNYRPFRASDAVLPIQFELPRDLPEGDYQLVISGWEQFLNDERTAKPFRFSAENSNDVFSVLRDLASLRHDSIYVRLIRQPDGIAIGRTAMPSLPSSRREVLIGAGRSNTTPFVSSTTKVIGTPYLMGGSAQFQVTIDKNAHVETGVGKPPAHHQPATPAQLPQPEGHPGGSPVVPGAPPQPPAGGGGEPSP